MIGQVGQSLLFFLTGIKYIWKREKMNEEIIIKEEEKGKEKQKIIIQ